MMYFVKFNGALRGKFMNWKTADLKVAPFPNSLAAILRSFAFYLALPISSIRGCSRIRAQELRPTKHANDTNEKKASSKIFVSFRLLSGQNSPSSLCLLAEA
jgi:hypothetical protein